MKIAVTQKHIQKGQRMRGSGWASFNQAERECPVAQAVREIYPNARVSTLSVVPDGNIRGEYILLPLVVKDFISKFDETGQGHPFEFTLNIECRV